MDSIFIWDNTQFKINFHILIIIIKYKKKGNYPYKIN